MAQAPTATSQKHKLNQKLLPGQLNAANAKLTKRLYAFG
jgi:hypothetical protein